MQAIFDTSVFIDFFRCSNPENSLFVKLVEKGYRPVVPMIVIAELYSGKSVWERSRAMKVVESTLSECLQLDLSSEIAQLAGKLRATLQISLFDALVAASALDQSLPLATLNKKDFEKIKKIVLL